MEKRKRCSASVDFYLCDSRHLASFAIFHFLPREYAFMAASSPICRCLMTDHFGLTTQVPEPMELLQHRTLTLIHDWGISSRTRWRANHKANLARGIYILVCTVTMAVRHTTANFYFNLPPNYLQICSRDLDRSFGDAIRTENLCLRITVLQPPRQGVVLKITRSIADCSRAHCVTFGTPLVMRNTPSYSLVAVTIH